MHASLFVKQRMWTHVHMITGRETNVWCFVKQIDFVCGCFDVIGFGNLSFSWFLPAEGLPGVGDEY